MVDLVRTVRTVPAFKADRVVRFLQVFFGGSGAQIDLCVSLLRTSYMKFI